MSPHGDRSEPTAISLTPTTDAPKQPWIAPQIFSIEHKDKIHTADGFNIYNYNGGAWAVSLTITTVYNINNVSCANDTFCVAIDLNNNAFVYSISSWAAPEPTASVNNNNGISCPTATFCMAVDSGGYAQEYAP